MKLRLPVESKKTTLPSLRIISPSQADIDKGKPAKGDDNVSHIETGYENAHIYRVATIPDGSCFFHAIMKAIYPKYQLAESYKERVDLAEKLRRDISVYLPKIYDNYPRFKEFSEIKKTVYDIDYSLLGLQKLFNSTRFVGEEVFILMEDILNMDIYVVVMYENRIKLSYRPSSPIKRPAIIIGGNETHYETIGMLTASGLQTVFSPEDPFIEYIRQT